jgi:uncharacterized membrane protein YccC
MAGPRVVWSPDAALRAIRATIVVPSILAVTFLVIGNGQMALFAVFGSFASLVLSTFAGTRRDKAIAHLGLTIVGTISIVVGTAVSGITWLAVLVTVPFALAIFLAGVAGPNASSGVTAALLTYVLPVASPGGLSTLPSRLEGWWLASAVCAAAVLLVSRRPAGDALRAAASDCAATLASFLDAVAHGRGTAQERDQVKAARAKVMDRFVATPYRPTGLVTADQAIGSLVHLLEWCGVLACDYLRGHADPMSDADTALLAATAGLLQDVAGLIAGSRRVQASEPLPHLPELQRARQASIDGLERLSGDSASAHAYASSAVHVQSIAVVAQAVGADAMIATGSADPETVAAERARWYGVPQATGGRVRSTVAGAIQPALTHASLRTVWFRNSLRGAVALSIAVLAADMLSLQHGFWVVLGTLSVLRSNAASTGSTALRALLGTCAGFAIGAAVLLAIGTGTGALWAVLPVAVLVASYAPGTAPFEVGQAGFTITIVVLFNLLVPVGWTVGLLRVEDVALGCAVSLGVGILFWPHGASSVVGDDLAEAFRRGGSYLRQAVDWALGLRSDAPDAGSGAIGIAIRLDDALRGFLAERGAKKISGGDLWTLIMAATRLRLTAYSVAGLTRPDGHASQDGDRVGGTPAMLSADARRLTGYYDLIAEQVGPPDRLQPSLIAFPPERAPAGPRAAGDGAESAVRAGAAQEPDPQPHVDPRTVWVSDHLRHLSEHADVLAAPALHVAEQRRLPWWR